ncbi:ABC transporter permease [Vagococcus lutrae]|uniref:ABC transporter permease n=1 Tax=Vagococcus lutrae TaxID=81947 RepID=UPI00288EC398|nr:ABC transporter permease [Vagococcus lutrae]MDT2811411.1 ABC transporter permease [Vagococcus lutrae]
MRNFKGTRYLPFAVFFLGLLGLIEWLVRQKVIPHFIIPAPSGVFHALRDNSVSLLGQHLPMILFETLLGFSLALLIGVGLALLMYLFPFFETLFYPFILISQTIPIIALSPIFILWFGYTIWSKVGMGFLLAFFPIVIGLYDGLKETDSEAVELFLTMGASRWTILKELQWPSAMPNFFSGLKLSVIYAMVGATIGEWLGASQGLGYYTRRMSGNLQAEGVFAAIVLLSISGMIFFGMITLIETYYFRWRKERKK